MEVNSNDLAFTRKRYIRNRKLVSENVSNFCLLATELHPVNFVKNYKARSSSKAKTFEELRLIFKPDKSKNNSIVKKESKNRNNLKVITKFKNTLKKVESSELYESDNSTPHLFTDYKECLNNILLDYFS